MSKLTVQLRHVIVAAIGASVLLLGNPVLLAQNEDSPASSQEEQASSSPDEQDEPDGYPAKEREIGNVMDIEDELT